MTIKRHVPLALLVVLALVAAACGSAEDDTTTTRGATEAPDTTVGDDLDEPEAEPDENADDQTSALMAAALRQLVTKDHTFGSGPPPFSTYLVLERLDPNAGSGGGPDRALTDAERAAIEGALEPFGPVTFIEDPDAFRTEDLAPTIEGAAIVGVGKPTIGDDSALVPVSLWCGGTCGTWLTYRVQLVDGAWEVTGIEGPIAIS